MACCDQHPLLNLIMSHIFLRAFIVAASSGIAAASLRYVDVDLDYNMLEEYLPNWEVYNVFIVFVSLVAGFRTAHALVRYTEAASLLHKLAATWYDVASTLVAFCRTSDAPPVAIDQFQDTLLRLVSLLSALCLEGLEQKSSMEVGHRFEVMGWADLSDEIHHSLVESNCKVEHVFQLILQLVVDAMSGDVLTIAPPILTRSFQEMGSGLVIYHEAKKLSRVPLPYAYRFLTSVILVCQAVFTPFMLVLVTNGTASAFLTTFMGTYLLWFLNGVADSLDNPFKKVASTLEPSAVQSELNEQLRELLSQRLQATPTLNRALSSESKQLHRGESMGTLMKTLTERHGPEPDARSAARRGSTFSSTSSFSSRPNRKSRFSVRSSSTPMPDAHQGSYASSLSYGSQEAVDSEPDFEAEVDHRSPEPTSLQETCTEILSGLSPPPSRFNGLKHAAGSSSSQHSARTALPKGLARTVSWGDVSISGRRPRAQPAPPPQAHPTWPVTRLDEDIRTEKV